MGFLKGKGLLMLYFKFHMCYVIHRNRMTLLFPGFPSGHIFNGFYYLTVQIMRNPSNHLYIGHLPGFINYKLDIHSSFNSNTPVCFRILYVFQ